MSATSERLAPSPPSPVGTMTPSSRWVRADVNASAGKRASRSTASALASATAAVASAREFKSPLAGRASLPLPSSNSEDSA